MLEVRKVKDCPHLDYNFNRYQQVVSLLPLLIVCTNYKYIDCNQSNVYSTPSPWMGSNSLHWLGCSQYTCRKNDYKRNYKMKCTILLHYGHQ